MCPCLILAVGFLAFPPPLLVSCCLSLLGTWPRPRFRPVSGPVPVSCPSPAAPLSLPACLPACLLACLLALTLASPTVLLHCGFIRACFNLVEEPSDPTLPSTSLPPSNTLISPRLGTASGQTAAHLSVSAAHVCQYHLPSVAISPLFIHAHPLPQSAAVITHTDLARRYFLLYMLAHFLVYLTHTHTPHTQSLPLSLSLSHIHTHTHRRAENCR
ncbi:hypothetical protein LX32DRAFT_16776 [Colletotrichum zoysiae]|uniref:Uncharacterized protein n=1 Tax=Colletotrichum zoysiae TaxID=1216348 RepID=A0AAD9HE39_9PEZI|nr:hypothetical protein LX32DRAFT_16776 [Colletotrichum zoysiae]